MEASRGVYALTVVRLTVRNSVPQLTRMLKKFFCHHTHDPRFQPIEDKLFFAVLLLRTTKTNNDQQILLSILIRKELQHGRL